MRFVDTNILLYAVSPAPAESAKQQLASALLDRTDLALSVQVLQEFYVQATRPVRPNRPWSLSHEEAIQFIETLMLHLPVQETTLDWCGRLLPSAPGLG